VVFLSAAISQICAMASFLQQDHLRSMKNQASLAQRLNNKEQRTTKENNEQ